MLKSEVSKKFIFEGNERFKNSGSSAWDWRRNFSSQERTVSNPNLHN
jgi:hypothetical protein